MEFNKEEMLRKYKELRDKYIETYVPDFTEDGYTISHGLMKVFSVRKQVTIQSQRHLPSPL